MKSNALLLIKVLLTFFLFTSLSVSELYAQDEDSLRKVARDSVRLALRDSLRSHLNDSIMGVIDSINSGFKYQSGEVKLFEGKATLRIPEGYKFLDAKQSRYVYRELWGNGKDGEEPQGLLLPERYGPLSPGVWAVEISYEETGHIKDNQAQKIDFGEVLKKMQNDLQEQQAVRKERGLEPVSLVGWAVEPKYDTKRHTLYWGKELRYGDLESTVLNYNIRMLGRKGVILLTVVGDMQQLPQIKGSAERIRSAFNFESGYRYKDFDPGVDEIAAVGLVGLIAGKLLLKVGMWAGVIKFGKWGLAAILAGWAFFARFFRKKKENERSETAENATPKNKKS